MDLTLESCDRIRLSKKLWPYCFEGDVFVKFLVFGFVDLSHSPAGDEANNTKSLGQQGSGCQALFANSHIRLHMICGNSRGDFGLVVVGQELSPLRKD